MQILTDKIRNLLCEIIQDIPECDEETIESITRKAERIGYHLEAVEDISDYHLEVALKAKNQ